MTTITLIPFTSVSYNENNENQMQADLLARSMMNNDMNAYWKDVRKNINVHLTINVVDPA